MLGDKKADFDPFKWSTGSDKDGKLRMAPWDSGTVGLYYRTDYFQAAGVDPSAVKTWDDLVAAGEKIKAATGGHTLLTADLSAGGSLAMYLQQQGQGYFDDEGRITVNSPAAVRALTLLQTMQQKGLIANAKAGTRASPAPRTATPPSPPRRPSGGSGPSRARRPSSAASTRCAICRCSTTPAPPTSNNGGSGLAIPAQAKNPQLAADFLTYVLANTENQSSMMQKEGLFPAYLPALKSDFFEQPSDYFGGQKVFQTFAGLTPEDPPPSPSRPTSPSRATQSPTRWAPRC